MSSEEIFKLQLEIKECSKHLNELLTKYFELQNKPTKLQKIIDIINSDDSNKINSIKSVINDDSYESNEKIELIKRFIKIETSLQCKKTCLIDFINLVSISNETEIIDKHLKILESYEYKHIEPNYAVESNITDMIAKIIVSRGSVNQRSIYQLYYLIGNGDISKLNSIYSKPNIQFKKVPDNFKSLMYFFDCYFKIDNNINLDVLEFLYDHNYDVEINELLLQMI